MSEIHVCSLCILLELLTSGTYMSAIGPHLVSIYTDIKSDHLYNCTFADDPVIFLDHRE